MKIKKTDVEIVTLTAKEVLLTLFDLTTPFYEASRLYRQSIRKYLEQRQEDRSNFLTRIKYLKRKGYIQTFTEGKEKYAELTPKGKKHSQILLLENIKIIRPQKWDSKWRVVIFDIPEKLKLNRDAFRLRLKRMNFLQVQKSVYVFPFECTPEVSLLSKSLDITKYVTIMISEIIQGEDRIIEYFLDNEVLCNKDLKKVK